MSPEDKKAAWVALQAACYQYEKARAEWDYATKGPFKDVQAQTNLVEAACQVALMKGYRPPAAPRAEGSAPVFGFGRNKGKTPAEVSNQDLVWYANVLRENVANPGKARWADSNQALLDAVEAEIEARK